MSLQAGTIHQLATSAPLKSAFQAINSGKILADAAAIQQIPAPTFDEENRARFVQKRFENYNLLDVEIDPLLNVYGRWPGASSTQPGVLVSAHLDTVFAAETDLAIRREGERLYGPGIGDNSLAVAGLLALIDLFRQCQIHPEADIWFVANSREEGLGNLDGIRAVWNRIGDRLGAGIVVEGMALGRIYCAGIAVKRLKITCHAPGGHSWLHYGEPSAIHGLVALGAQIIGLDLPERPRSTVNIGLIEGGASINSLAPLAALYLDLRSETAAGLEAVAREIQRAIDMTRREGLGFDIEVVGERPAGVIDQGHPLVKLAADSLHAAGYDPVYEKGSTDANLLLAKGLPAVTVGITYGANAHRLDEYIETRFVRDGIWHLLLLVLGAAGQVRTWVG